MGKRGPPRKPTELLKLHGTYREDRHATRGDQQAPAAPLTKPKGLSATASQLWDQIVREYQARNLLGEIDQAVLQSCCEMWSFYRAAAKRAAKEPTNKDARLAVTQYFAAFNRAALQFGLTPAARANMQIEVKQTAPQPEFARKRS